jgi:hypothetical protein
MQHLAVFAKKRKVPQSVNDDTKLKKQGTKRSISLIQQRIPLTEHKSDTDVARRNNPNHHKSQAIINTNMMFSEEGLRRTMRISVFLSSLLLMLVVGNAQSTQATATTTATTATAKKENDDVSRYYDRPQPLTSGTNPYDVLGIEVGSSERKIKQTFRRLVDEKCAHGDLCTANNQRYFREILQSYEALIDDDTRKENYKHCNNWYCFDAVPETDEAVVVVVVKQQNNRLHCIRNSSFFLLMVVGIGFVISRCCCRYDGRREEESYKSNNNNNNNKDTSYGFGGTLLLSSCCSFLTNDEDTSMDAEEYVMKPKSSSKDDDDEAEEFVVEEETYYEDCEDWEIVNIVISGED